MPGVDRLGWRHGLLDAVAEARSYGVNSVVLFPKVSLAKRAPPLCTIAVHTFKDINHSIGMTDIVWCRPQRS